MKLDWLEKVLAPLVGRDETLLLVLQVFLVVLGVVLSVIANFILRRVFHRIGADRVDQASPRSLVEFLRRQCFGLRFDCARFLS